MDTQCMERIGSVKEFKHFIRTFIAQALPAVGVDMVHEQRDISLCQRVKGSSFGKDIADELMVLLNRALSGQARKDHSKKYGFSDYPAGQIRWLSGLKTHFRCQ